jgi:acyl-CoA thioester hydrolase
LEIDRDIMPKNPQPASARPNLEFIDDPAFVVRPEDVDYNGHLNFGNYTVLFELAIASLRRRLRIGPEDLAAIGLDWFAREAHISYRRELVQGDRIRFSFRLLACDANRVHIALSMFQAGNGWLAATCEIVALCVAVGSDVRRWPPDGMLALQEMHSLHLARAPSANVGLAISVRNPHPAGTFSCSAVETASTMPADIDGYIRKLDFYDTTVPADYTDGNGAIILGFYPLLFTVAARRFFFEAVGIGEPFMELTGQTNFVAQAHLIQMRKLRRGDPLAYGFKMIALGDKVFHCMSTIRHGREGWVAAVQEQLDVCVDLSTRRPVNFHSHTRHRLELALAQTAHEPDSAPPGRAVVMDC